MERPSILGTPVGQQSAKCVAHSLFCANDWHVKLKSHVSLSPVVLGFQIQSELTVATHHPQDLICMFRLSHLYMEAQAPTAQFQLNALISCPLTAKGCLVCNRDK